MASPLPSPRVRAHRRSALARTSGWAVAVAIAASACARPDELTFSPEVLDRDRAARETVVAEIEIDHEKLAALISSDRFEQPETIYTDPELRELALRLVEQTRKLRRLADSNVLSPGAP